MHLLSDNHVFWANIDTTTWSDSVDIHIGNSKNKLFLSVYKDEVVLQELTYYGTCSHYNQLEIITETIEMLQAAFKAVLHVYPAVTKIVLTDRCYYPHSMLGNIPMAEHHFFIYGKTWYQEYLGTIPNARTQRVLNKYTTTLSNTTVCEYMSNKKEWMTEKDIHTVREKLGLPLLTGTQWEIPRSIVEQYPTIGVFKEKHAD